MLICISAVKVQRLTGAFVGHAEYLDQAESQKLQPLVRLMHDVALGFLDADSPLGGDFGGQSSPRGANRFR